MENSGGGIGGGAKRYSGDPFAGPKVLQRAPPASLNGEGTAIVWFRNDLRVGDNAALALANSAANVVPVYVFDDRFYGMHNASPHGFQRTGPYRAQFLVDSVRELRSSLRWKMSDLVLRVGRTEDVIAELAQILLDNGLGPVCVVAQKEVTREETDMESLVAKNIAKLTASPDSAGDAGAPSAPVDMHFIWGSTMLHVDDLPFNPAGPGLPGSFTEFRKAVEAEAAKCETRKEITLPNQLNTFPRQLKIKSDDFPTLRDGLGIKGLADPNDFPYPHPNAVMTFKGGEKAGLERINDWIFSKGCLSTYFISRNDSGTMDFSSKFSAWLALGCISPRTIYWACKKFEEQKVANKSTYWMVFELLTRDYFRWVAAQARNKMFALNGFTGRGFKEQDIWYLPRNAITDVHKARFEAWRLGMTGAPFIDASMRELNATGFMSNRGRQNVASFLIHDLEYPDWRAGAEYFESQLIDHDVTSNWANWAYLAGVGTDPRGGRRFNVVKQAMQYDPSGWYTKRWVGELHLLPAPYVHEPHTLSDAELTKLQVIPGVTYPRPIVKLLRGPRLEQSDPMALLKSVAQSLDASIEGAASPQRKYDEKIAMEAMMVRPDSPDEVKNSPEEIAAREEAAKYSR
jgi:deoxyribodipyrimidine photo-lyase